MMAQEGWECLSCSFRLDPRSQRREKVVVREIIIAKKSLWQPVFGAEQSKYSMYRGKKKKKLLEVLHPKGGWALEQAQGSGDGTESARAQEEFGRLSEAHLGLSLMICVVSFQARVFHNSNRSTNPVWNRRA